MGIEEEDLKKLITGIKISEYFEFKDKDAGMTWIKTPVLVNLKKKPKITINEEHDDFCWVKKDELLKFDTIVDLEHNLECALR